MRALLTLVVLMWSAPSVAGNDPYAHGGARNSGSSGGGATMPPVHTMPGQGVGPKSGVDGAIRKELLKGGPQNSPEQRKK